MATETWSVVKMITAIVFKMSKQLEHEHLK